MKWLNVIIYCIIQLNCKPTQCQVTIPIPTPQQLHWHDMEFYLFLHFGPNTFTDVEWGKGTEKEEIFNPQQMDCEQWCRIAQQAGAKGIIITAKHHDGFCLWPSNYSTHTVRESKWRDGKGDVLKDLSAACKKYGLKFGVYISPWDRNHPDYGTAKYNTVFENMMKEIFTNYGPIWELWWDGANGEGPNGKKQVYDFRGFEKLVRRISPQTLIFSDIGPDIRWCGNESGIAGLTNWNRLDTAGYTRGAGGPPTDSLNAGNLEGKYWIPAECDVSIRPGWFYHQQEDAKVKSGNELFQLYLKSVGRGANLLLNVPPDNNGLISNFDSTALINFYTIRKNAFKTDLINGMVAHIGATKKTVKQLTDANKKSFVVLKNKEFIQIHLTSPVAMNTLVIEEYLGHGQSIRSGYVQVRSQQQLDSFMFTSIGNKRIINFPKRVVEDIFIYFLDTNGPAYLASVAAYALDEKLVEK